MRVFIHPYKSGLASAILLSEGLTEALSQPVRRILKNPNRPSRYRPKRTDVMINWGATSTPFDSSLVPLMFNPPSSIETVVDKRRFLQGAWTNPNIRVPEWSTELETAQTWTRCVSRTLTRASGGRGIVVTRQGEEIPAAPLYCRYVPKNAEFRVHVVDGQVIDTQRKIRDPSREPTNWRVRSHANGFIFARDSGQPSQESLDMAVETVEHFGLNFGAVDIIENKKGSWVLEVNTAPGLEGQTLTNYVAAFQSSIGI